jgi:hypothetical protein
MVQERHRPGIPADDRDGQEFFILCLDVGASKSGSSGGGGCAGGCQVQHFLRTTRCEGCPGSSRVC